MSNMTSFYGGKQGNAFVIKKSFLSVEDMSAALLSKETLSEIEYGEYALIDTEDKNDIDNGKIYKRTSEGVGYEYVGQIVGPSGSAPEIEFAESLAALQSYANNKSGTQKSVPLKMTAGVQGNSDINKAKIHWVSVQTSNGLKSNCLIYLDVPYVSIDFTAEKVASGDPATVEEVYIDGVTNDFFHKYNIKIPSGNGIEDVKMDSATGKLKILYDDYNHSEIQTNEQKEALYKNIGDLSYIKKIMVVPESSDNYPYHLLVIFSNDANIDIVASQVEYNNETWYDFGSIKGKDSNVGLRIKTNVTQAEFERDFKVKSTDANYTKSPEAVFGSDYVGWGVVVTNGDNQTLYIYDYSKKYWIPLNGLQGDFGNTHFQFISLSDYLNKNQNDLENDDTMYIIEDGVDDWITEAKLVRYIPPLITNSESNKVIDESKSLQSVIELYQNNPEQLTVNKMLDLLQEAIKNNSARSHVGMIIHSLTLDTQEKVITEFGGTKWERLTGTFLRDSGSSGYTKGSTAGQDFLYLYGYVEGYQLNYNQIPEHSHPFETNEVGNHTHMQYTTVHQEGSEDYAPRSDWNRDWDSTGNNFNKYEQCYSGYSGKHSHSGRTGYNSTLGQAHNHELKMRTNLDSTHTQVWKTGLKVPTLPKYQNVYIWLRTE